MRIAIGSLVGIVLLSSTPGLGTPRGGSLSKGAAPAVAEPAPAALVSQPATADSVAVLEYRTAVAQIPDLPDQVAQALKNNTSLKILSPREGRQKFGAKLDAEVATCAGDASCLSSIGQKLGVKEVLLTAVSQLGDIVLALQRIDVTTKAVSARVADSLASGQAVNEPRVMVWLQQLYPVETFKRYGQVRVLSDVEGAQLYINAKPRGKTPLREPVLVLAPGNYRLLLEKPKYLPFQAAVTVMPESTVEVSARLLPEIAPTPWYKRWYVWTALSAGVVAATSVTVAAVLVTREPPPDMTKVPGVIEIK